MSLQDQAKQFEAIKKANSPWLTIDDGETVVITQLRAMKAMEKTDPTTGVTSAVMSFDVDVETIDGLKVKKLNTSSSKLVNLFIEKGIDIGSSFKITKRGEKFATTYEVTDVVNKAVKTVSAQPVTSLDEIPAGGEEPKVA